MSPPVPFKLPDLFEVIEATWPPAQKSQQGHWYIRRGDGGGKRVSAATPIDGHALKNIEQAETAMEALGQPVLFSLRPEQQELDDILQKRGYQIVDPSILLQCPIDALTQTKVPPVTAFPIWPPLQIMYDIWAAGGIGPGRLAVMNRVKGPKTSILGRTNDRAAGAAFVAIHKGVAMVHAVEVLQDQRRAGLARHMMHAAAHWAKAHDARYFALVTTKANAAALALYASLGMKQVGQYHYRIKP